MALARDFKETVLARVRADPKFRDALLEVKSKVPHQPQRTAAT